MKKYKVLVLTDKLNIGGYDLVAYNFATNMNNDIFEFIFLVRGSEKGLLEDEVIKKGFRVIHQPENTKSYFKSYYYLKRLFQCEHFDIVHSHLNFYSGIVCKSAYKSGIKVRAAHAHFTDPCIENRSKLKTFLANIYESVMRIWLSKYCNLKIACGTEAGAYLYGDKTFKEFGILLNNGVDTNRFCYDIKLRETSRKELGIKDKIVLGHCGRFNYVKNHKFLIDVFYEFQLSHTNSTLLLVGDGEQRKNIEEKAEKLGISDKLIITGMVTDTEKFYNSMDCFVFPSIHEGFPLTLVEAQATKLPCLISNEVTKFSKINDNISFLPLDNVKDWAKEIETLISVNRNNVSIEHLINDFSLKGCSLKLEEMYLNSIKGG